MESTAKIWVDPKPYFSFAPEHSNTPSKWLVIINNYFPFFFLPLLRLFLTNLPPFSLFDFLFFFFFYLLCQFLSPLVSRYVDGQQYMSDVADAILAAKDEIYITDWQ